jgi:hypothetical protein
MLPKQNIMMYELTVPSNGQKVKFRPFTVREEKLLLIAQQSEDIKVMIQTLKDIIDGCTENKVEVEKLAVFDLEYIMANLRAKSVGETVRLQFDCDKDATHEAIVVDLDMTKLEVFKPDGHDKRIPLFGNVGVVMRYPDATMLETLAKIDLEPNAVFGIIYDCIDYIYDDQEIFPAKEQSEADLVQFIDGLTKEQFQRIQEFFETMPKFMHTVEYKCQTCGHEHKKRIEGFSNFFY